MGSGYSKMRKQARLMQEQISQMRETMQSTLFEGNAGNGLVTVTINGEKALQKIALRPECVDPNDVEGLQDLILAAFEDANQKLQAQQETQNSGAGEGLVSL